MNQSERARGRESVRVRALGHASAVARVMQVA